MNTELLTGCLAGSIIKERHCLEESEEMQIGLWRAVEREVIRKIDLLYVGCRQSQA